MDEPTPNADASTGDAQAAEDAAVEPGPDRRPGSKVEPTDLTIALTPRQILGGFALLAALVMLLRRRGRDQDRAGRS